MAMQYSSTVQQHLEELQLISCSLLPSERLSFSEGSEFWRDALNKYSEGAGEALETLESLPTVEIRVDGATVWFAITFVDEPADTRRDGTKRVQVSVKGEDLSRVEQERWQTMIQEKLDEIGDSDFPAYQLVSLHLLPALHEEVEKHAKCEKNRAADQDKAASHEEATYHVLFTSHHLKSATKRRLLQQWFGSLSLHGFANVGHPGVIYAQGKRSNIEEFVDNVKAMQWLALKVRFVEPVKDASTAVASTGERAWKEFQKVGEVVEEMRKIGREEYVVEMGIGSAGSSAKA